MSTFTISCFAAIIMLSRVILTKMAIAHARRGPETTKNLETLPSICILTIQHSGAMMMIKGSLLCSIPTVKRFRAKKFFCEKSENGSRIDGFGGFWMKKF